MLAYYMHDCALHSDTASKLKNIHIREASNPVTTATVDDIKASLKGLQLPSPHAPILSKAGSLNALNSKTCTHVLLYYWSLITELNVTDKSPSSSRRTYLSPTERYSNHFREYLYSYYLIKPVYVRYGAWCSFLTTVAYLFHHRSVPTRQWHCRCLTLILKMPTFNSALHLECLLPSFQPSVGPTQLRPPLLINYQVVVVIKSCQRKLLTLLISVPTLAIIVWDNTVVLNVQECPIKLLIYKL